MKFRYDVETERLIVSESTRTEYHQIGLWLTRHVKGWRFHPKVKMRLWDGKLRYFDDGQVNLGLWRECMKACQEIEHPFLLENKEDFPLNRDVTLESVEEFCREFFKEHMIKKGDEYIPFMPYDYQIQSVYKILRNRYCMAEVATSGGKSLIISIVMFYIMKNIKPDAKFLIIVPSITLVTQFFDNILEYNYGFDKVGDLSLQELEQINDDTRCSVRIEEIMSDKPRKFTNTPNPNIYIGTYQSLDKWPKKFFEQFYMVTTDEAHGAKSNTLIKLLTHTFGKATYRFGVSGTFPNDDTAEILTIQSVLGPKITEVTADELKKKGVITPMEIKVIMLNHDDPEYYGRLKPLRKSEPKIALDLEKKYTHESNGRMDFIKKLVSKFTNNSLLLFHTIENGKKIFETLSEQLPDHEFFYIDGEVSGKKREAIKAQMEITTGKPKILVASYGTLSTGVSIKAIFNIVFADSFKSEQIIIQSIGRGLRLHHEKEKVVIYDIVDIFDMKDIGNALYRHYKEREGFYLKRKYPYKEYLINLNAT